MTRANPAFTSFNAGVLSPLLGGRPDLEKWQAGLAASSNMIPRVQGALQRAGGTVYVGAVKSGRAWLAPFVFSQADAFLLEFGDGYIRFYRSRGRFVTGTVSAWSSLTAYEVGDLAADAGVSYYCVQAHTNQAPPAGAYWYPLTGDIYEIPSPYLTADLTRDDGSFGVRYEQSGDVIYLACRGHKPRTLTRLSNTKWVMAEFEPDGGPFKDENLDESITVTATGTMTVGGTVTITASEAIFQADHVGALFRLELEDGADVKAWQVRTSTDVNDIRRAGLKFYKCTQVGPVDTTDKPAICGEDLPVHTRGRYWDGTGEEQKGDGAVGSIGVEWEYLHAGYGWVRIAGYSSGTSVTATVLSRLPDELATDATHRWAFGAWSEVEGWPDNVCFFRERLTFTRDQFVWHSVSGGFDDFKAMEHGEVRPDSAVSISVQSAQGNPIEWITPYQDALFIGTNGGEHVLQSQTTQQPYGPGNTQQDPQTAWGGVGVDPVVCGAGVVFVERLGRKLRLLVQEDNWDAVDLNKYHGVLPAAVTSVAWQQNPHETLWCGLANGELRGLTLQVKDNVVGWHPHDLAGEVESVAVIPAPDGGRDDLWVIVKRTIDGVDVRYVEYRAAEYEAGDDRSLAIYAASALTYDGTATTTLSGLGHLEGETVQVMANGAAHPDCIVDGGEIELNVEATKAVVGLAMPYNARLMPLDAGAMLGTAQARTKRVHSVDIRLLDSLGGALGPAFGATDVIEYRLHGMDMDAAPPLYTGDKQVQFPGDYEGQATIALEGDGPFPFTMLALFPELVTYEG
ncbi:MAG: hypothetical protein ACK4RV_02225 [Caulobacter sp.]